jgi:hypothetical protein
MEKLYEKWYAKSSVWRFIASMLLFFALFKVFPPKTEYTGDWTLLVLTAALLAEAVLQRAKELHVLFGGIICTFCLYLIYNMGINVCLIVAILAVITEIPSLTAGCAAGMGLWLAQTMTGACSWVDVLNRFDCGWIVIILLFTVADGMMDDRTTYGKASYVRIGVWNFISFFLWIALVVAGIVLLAGERRGSISTPEIFSRIHLIRVGLGIFLVQAVTLRRFKIVDFAIGGVDDEPVDD